MAFVQTVFAEDLKKACISVMANELYSQDSGGRDLGGVDSSTVAYYESKTSKLFDAMNKLFLSPVVEPEVILPDPVVEPEKEPAPEIREPEVAPTVELAQPAPEPELQASEVQLTPSNPTPPEADTAAPAVAEPEQK